MIGIGLAVSLISGVRRKASIALNSSGTVDISVGDGTITITVSGADYAHHNGTHGPFATSDLDTGPISVVAPVIAGTAGTGEVLTSAPGLWMFETGDAPTITATWQRDDVDISGETGTTYTTTTTDEGTGVEYQETATNTAGSRLRDSNAIPIPGSSSFAVSRIGGFQSSASNTITPSYTIDLTNATVGDIVLLFQGSGKHAASATVGGNAATKITTNVAASGSNRVTAFRYTVTASEAANASVAVTFTLDATTTQHVMSAHLVVGGVIDEAAVAVNGTADAPKLVSASATPTNANNYMLACMMGAGTFTNPGDETWANATRIDGAKMTTATTRDISIASQEDVAIASYSMTCTTPLSGKTAIIIAAISEAP